MLHADALTTIAGGRNICEGSIQNLHVSKQKHTLISNKSIVSHSKWCWGPKSTELLSGVEAITISSAPNFTSPSGSPVSSTIPEAENEKNGANRRPARACRRKPSVITNGAASEAELNRILPLSQQEREMQILHDQLSSDSSDEDYVPGKYIVLYKPVIEGSLMNTYIVCNAMPKQLV